MRISLLMVFQAIALLAAAAPALAQVAVSDKDLPANGSAGQGQSKQDLAELAQAAALLQDLSRARETFRSNSTERNGDALDKAHIAIAKARVHTEAGLCALEAAYDFWGKPTGDPTPTWEQTFEQLTAWRKACRDSAPASIATGKAYVRFAWEARGGGFAAKVSDEQFALFHDRIAQARIYLTAAESKSDVDAELYRLRIDISKAEGSPPEEAAAWLQKAQKLDPDYEPAFSAMAESLMPRWGGQPGDLEKFSRDVLSKLSGDEGKMTHAKVAGTLSMFGHHELLKSRESREQVHAGAVLLAGKYRHSVWCQNVAGFVGMYTGDIKLCKQTLPVVEKDRLKVFWTAKNFDKYFAIARTELPGPPLAVSPPSATKFMAFLAKTGQLAAVSGNRLKSVSLWEPDGNQPAAIYPLRSLNAFALAPTLDGSRLCLAYRLDDQNRDAAAVMNPKNGEMTIFSDEDTRFIRSVCISADGKLAATVDGMLADQVTIWDVSARKALLHFSTKGSQGNPQFSPDGKYLATSAHYQTTVWSLEQKKEVLNIRGGADDARLGDYELARFVGFRGEHEIMFYAHSNATKEDNFVVRKLEDENLSTLLRTKDGRLESFCLSPSKNLIAAMYRPQEQTSQMKGVQIWDLEHGKLLGETPPMNLEGVQQLAFSPDNSRLAICTTSPRGFDVFEIADLPSKPAAP